MTTSDLTATASAIVDANRFMTLATADERGLPWASPVWFARVGYAELFWISSPGARHSRNIAVRPEVGIVIFDSTVEPGKGTGTAVYMSATAGEVADEDLERGAEVFSRVSQEQGLSAWSPADMRPPANRRLYHALVSGHWLLGEGDVRIAVGLLS